MAERKQNWKQLKLVTTKGAKSGEEHRLDRPTIGIGRSHLNQIVLRDLGVSPFHARILVQGKKCIITDLGAHDGLRVNAKKVDTAILSPGDKVEIGEVHFDVAKDIPSQKVIPKKKQTQRKKEKFRINFRLPVRFSLLIIVLTAILVFMVILDVHWLIQIINWE